MSNKTFYVTTPIYYVNDAPHIGHAYTTVLADVLSRYHKLLGNEVFFLTGTDEHGQKVQQAAEKRGVAPQAHCDEYSERFKSAWKDLNIEFNHFIRTTDPTHKEYVRKQLQKLWEMRLPNGDPLIYEEEYMGWYSVSEERFFAEEELTKEKTTLNEGGYKQFATVIKPGDTNLTNDTELFTYADPISGRPVEWIKEKNYFFRMSAFQKQLIDHINQESDFIMPDFRKNEVLGFLKQPLRDLCISRPKSRLAWGVPLPFDEDYVAYVWVDALLNYASAVDGKKFANGQEIWPADFHLIGKDILTTHAVYWTTLLMALGMPLPKHILAHGWWMFDNARMSKTTGNVVSPLAMKDKYGVDAFRFFLIREMVVGSDASFSEEVFVSKLNSDLANDVGNGLSRVLKLAQTFEFELTYSKNDSDEYVSSNSGTQKFYAYETLFNEAKAFIGAIPDDVREVDLNYAVNRILGLFGELNRYLELTAPWKLAKGGDSERQQLRSILWHSAEALRLGFTYLYPVMPQKMDEALAALGLTFEESRKQLLWRETGSFSVKSISPLFPRIDTKTAVVSTGSTTVVSVDPFSNIELRVVKILSVEDHPNAEALYVLQVDAGDGTRTVCAGLKKYLTPEELIGKTGVLVANLKPALLRGVASQGMMLAAEGLEGKLSLANPESAQPGDSIMAEGLNSNPKPQITLKDFEKCPLSVKNGRVYYKGHSLTSRHGPVLANAPDGAVVR